MPIGTRQWALRYDETFFLVTNGNNIYIYLVTNGNDVYIFAFNFHVFFHKVHLIQKIKKKKCSCITVKFNKFKLEFVQELVQNGLGILTKKKE